MRPDWQYLTRAIRHRATHGALIARSVGRNQWRGARRRSSARRIEKDFAEQEFKASFAPIDAGRLDQMYAIEDRIAAITERSAGSWHGQTSGRSRFPISSSTLGSYRLCMTATAFQLRPSWPKSWLGCGLSRAPLPRALGSARREFGNLEVKRSASRVPIDPLR